MFDSQIDFAVAINSHYEMAAKNGETPNGNKPSIPHDKDIKMDHTPESLEDLWKGWMKEQDDESRERRKALKQYNKACKV